VADAARTADQTTTVTVQLVDAFGNALSSSSGTVVLNSDIGDITGLSDLGNGTWTATFVAVEPGTATITGTLDAVAITDNAQVVVTAGTVSTTTTTVTASPTSIEASSGATVSTITVVARDGDNNPVPGVTVELSATGSNNTITQPSGVTDASGIATGTISSTTAELKTVNATVNTAAVTDDATVTVTATTPSPANIQITVNDANITSDETATVTIQLIDQFGNLRTTNEGAITLSTNIGSLTDPVDNGDGTWTSTFDGATAGEATISGFWSGNPITDNATVTVTAGAASQIAINAGNGQSAVAGTAVGIDPSVIVRDAANNPVAGVEVTFAIVSGGGALVDSVVVTGVDGIATLGSWTLGTTAGANSISATAPGLTGSPLTFTATGTPGDATQLVFTTQPTNTQVNATISTFVVEARDSNGNLATGFAGDVTVSVEAGGLGSLTGTVTVTAVGGIITYSNVQADTVQTGLVIRAAFPGLTAALSSPINITL
jgi:adhesin/invasin